MSGLATRKTQIGLGAVIAVGLAAGLSLFEGVTAAPSEGGGKAKKQFPGLEKPGKLKGIALRIGDEKGDAKGQSMTLTGPEARAQLVATGRYDSGQVRDWTRKVSYKAWPLGVVDVSSSGYVRPLKNGKATITAVAKDGDLTSSVKVKVKRQKDAPRVSFPNQIIPKLTKLGCNNGGCHGKGINSDPSSSGGQNGFRLSLLGFYPKRDYEYLVNESRGRRLMPAAPEQSLMLLKASGSVPHEGGKRMAKTSRAYKLLRRWIDQGMPYSSKNDPTLKGIRVYPGERTLPRDGKHQLRVIAHYSDGSKKDVTRVAQYESDNTNRAEVTKDGVVKMLGRPGEVSIMARYQANVATFRATVPFGADVKEFPEPNNFIDKLVFRKLEKLGLPPSKVCDDATFIRRATLDIAGRLPKPKVAKEFVASDDPEKRSKYIDRLLASGDYADNFAMKWKSILRNKRRNGNFERGNYAFYQWIRQSLYNNKPYDQFVRELLTASGKVGENPPVAWYREVRKKHKRVEDTAQLFLGVRIQCARCHHHPFEKWSQDDYYKLQGFFSRLRKKGSARNNRAENYRVYHRYGNANSRNPTSGERLKPAGFGGKTMEIPPGKDPRKALVDWMTKPDNPFFAKALANRYWSHFFGRGIVEPADDIRKTNPPSNPALLEALEDHFVKTGYDLKELIRTICNSKVYQLSSVPNKYNKGDKQQFSRYYPKRLRAEVLLDAIDQVNGTETGFNGLPKQVRAVEIPDHGSTGSYFLSVFGRPEGSSACECERSSKASLAQSLHLLNSRQINRKLRRGRAKKLAKDDSRSVKQKITDLYYRALSRPPSEKELKKAVSYIKSTKNKRNAYEDVVWALLNTKEFLFNH